MNKKLIALFAGLLLVSTPCFALPPDPTYYSWNNKSERTGQNDAVRDLKLVRFANEGPNQASMASGDLAVYDTVSADGITIGYTTISADGSIAGVVVTKIPSADSINQASFLDDRGHRNWGWLVVHGPALVSATAGGTNGNNVGDPFITSGDTGKVTGFISLDSAAGSINGIQVSDRLKTLGKEVSGVGGVFLTSGDGTTTLYKVMVEKE